MSWRDQTQRARVARVLLAQIHREDLWGERGPTDTAITLLEDDGAEMSRGGRVLFLAAFDAWNAHGSVRFEEVLYSLDPKRVALIGSLMVAYAQGGAAIDAWIEAQEGGAV